LLAIFRTIVGIVTSHTHKLQLGSINNSCLGKGASMLVRNKRLITDFYNQFTKKYKAGVQNAVAYSRRATQNLKGTKAFFILYAYECNACMCVLLKISARY